MQTHILSLSQEGTPQLGPGEVLQLPPPYEPYVLRIVLPGTSPVLNERGCALWCNYPEEGEEFDRHQFQKFELKSPLKGNCVVDIKISHSGAFDVSFGERIGGPLAWNFVVQPSFSWGAETLTANGLCVQTVLSKLVDPEHCVRSERWQRLLDSIAAKNYNMIHFVPLQPRGESDSPFSIADQLEWDSHTFPKGIEDVKFLLNELKKRKIFGLTDIVLNHTASDSKWLKEHPEAGYSVKTAPHLEAAIALDSALLEVHNVEINNLGDLSKIEGVVRQCAAQIRLWEFYIIDVEKQLATLADSERKGDNQLNAELNAVVDLVVEKTGVNFNVLGPRFNRYLDSETLAEIVNKSAFSARDILNAVNLRLYNEYNDDLNTSVRSITDRQRFLRLDDNGPKIGNKADPIIETYFNRRFGTPLACNGWVWGGDPLIDHAGPHSKAYIRRELIVWGDCTKLRYGEKREDSPYLWDRMTKYVHLMAEHFSGIRVDNAHSTPLHVGVYLMDEARKVRPNLYVVAELFSGSQEKDKMYVEHMGLSSLLREAIMPGNPKDFSTVVHENGGLPIGSLIDDESVRGSKTHAWLMEVTHDNEAMAQKRTVEDTLSTAGLVAMCPVSSGSTYGSDEGYARGLNIVTETRPYTIGGGIGPAKAVLNKLHSEMAKKNMFESYTDHKDQYITVHRINPETGEGVYLIARTKFYEGVPEEVLPPVRLEASKATFFAGWSVSKSGVKSEDDLVIPLTLKELKVKTEVDDKGSTITPPSSAEFPAGSIAIWKTERLFDASGIEALVRKDASPYVKNLSLLDLNVLLYHSNGEERTCSGGERGVYNVPNLGELVYAGLQGWETHLSKIVRGQDLGHPICANIRSGLWAFEYLINRLPGESFAKVREYLTERYNAALKVPTFMRPRYFIATVQQLYYAAVDHALNLLGIDVSTASEFLKKLALTSVQLVSELPNCSLYPDKIVPTMAAGLPHFSEGIMRCWGRDVFLSTGGLLIRLKRYEEAEQHILGFGATLKYGLIPNLLDSGRNPRYNARDAVWFFVECIQQYCVETGNYSFLDKKVKRRFPLDDSYTETTTDQESSIGDLVYEVLQRHAGGITFREHNAGPRIDSHMTDNGFNQKIWVDWNNGFVFGGNPDNCGTWMDKMGESQQAKNDGVPGTPRDGAAVEIISLLKSCLRWVNESRSKGKYKWPLYVTNQYGKRVNLNDWESLIQQNFEKLFYVPTDPAKDSEYDVDPKIVNRRGIYKDLYHSSKPYEDYQLRPNFTVGVISAPELFANGVQSALDIAGKALCGPVGIATLDPSDWNYRPYYLNQIDNDDFATSKGRNYHQGPEWVWLLGTYLQAYVQTMKAKHRDPHEMRSFMRNHLQGNIKWIDESPWCGLTELTQKNGEFCADSSPTQAWSSARILEALLDASE